MIFMVSERCVMDFDRKLTKNFSDHTSGVLGSDDDLMRFMLESLFFKPSHSSPPRPSTTQAYPLGLVDCQRQASSHISSMPFSACQPSSFQALPGSA